MGQDTDTMTEAGLQQERLAAREALAHDVELLAEKISPSAIVDRRLSRLRRRFNFGKRRVSNQLEETVHDVSNSMQDVGGNVGSTIQEWSYSATEMAKRRSRQMPLATGALFFVIGWAVSRLIPMGRSEGQVLSQVTETVTEKAAPIVDEAKTAVTESAKEAIANH